VTAFDPKRTSTYVKLEGRKRPTYARGMATNRAKDPDQLARFRTELKEGTFFENARQRSRRRKSGWNLLLPLFAFPMWGGIVFLLSWLASALHATVYPAAAPLFGSGPLRMGAALVQIPCLLAAVFPALVLTNFLVYLIPRARRAMDLEGRDSGSGYGASQSALVRAGLWAFAVCLPLMVVGALLR
jgi:hypothetical protein